VLHVEAAVGELVGPEAVVRHQAGDGAEGAGPGDQHQVSHPVQLPPGEEGVLHGGEVLQDVHGRGRPKLSVSEGEGADVRHPGHRALAQDAGIEVNIDVAAGVVPFRCPGHDLGCSHHQEGLADPTAIGEPLVVAEGPLGLLVEGGSQDQGGEGEEAGEGV